MKKNRLLLIAILGAFALSSCNDWLDVKPKTQVESSELLASESGYKDALWGVYTTMTESAMYGVSMTVSTDAMAQLYSSPGTSSTEYRLMTFNYTDSYSETLINNVWTRTYFTIANINNLIGNLKNADPGMFAEDNYNVIYGEALGLRAYLHFDLLRLFAPSYAADKDAEAIPYVTEFNYTTTSRSTVSGALDKITGDLLEAIELLKVSDPVYTGREITTRDDNGYLLNRKYHLNYYAAVATLARVYLWKGDKTNASKYAKEVITSGQYEWTSVDSIAVAEDQRNRTFTPEQVFTLHVEKMETNLEQILTTDSRWNTTRSLLVSSYVRDKIYPYTTDWRGNTSLYFWSEATGTAGYGYRVPSKLFQYEEMPDTYKCLLPLIRLPEMYLIVAECNPGEAPGIINDIRANRGIAETFSPAATPTEVSEEIMNEYRREFYCEGVMWYYWKRLNYENIPYFANYGGTLSARVMSPASYTWPMPKEEIEFR
jgi:hypothetical protein